MRKRVVLVSAASLALAGLVGLAGCHSSSQAQAPVSSDPPAAAVAIVKSGSISQTLSLAGQFQPYQVVEVHPKVSGFIRNIYVDIGDRVHKGETLAVLEVPELKAQLEGSVANVKQSQDQIAQAEQELDAAKSRYVARHEDYTRLLGASEAQPGLIAAQELDDAQAKSLSAQAQVDAAEAALNAAKSGKVAAHDNFLRYNALDSYTRVTAPLDGVITWRYADTGALIQSGRGSNQQSLPIVKLAQINPLRLRMPVPENDVKYVHVGDPMTIQVAALGRSFAGKVVRFTHDVSLQTRTMETEVDVPNPNFTIDPGMYANTQLQLAHVTNVPTLPVGAIVDQNGQSVVYVIGADNRVAIRPVQIGLEGSLLAQITGGLELGDRVIAGGQQKYQPGELVSPVVEKSPVNDVSQKVGGEIDLSAGQGDSE